MFNTTPQQLYPLEGHPVPLVQETVWDPGPVRKISLPPRFVPQTIRAVVSSDWTVPLSQAVTLCIVRFNLQSLYTVLTLHLCCLYGSGNKQRLSYYTEWDTSLTEWFCITEVESVYCAVRTDSFYETDTFHL